MRFAGKLFALILALLTLSPALAEADDGIIRVELRSLGAPGALHLTFDGAYSVEANAGFRFESGADAAVAEAGGELWLSAGGMLLNLGPEVTLTRHCDSGLYIDEAAKHNLYMGDLTLSARDGGVRSVLSIDIEDYLCGVVAYEMSNAFPIEALKAQSVAARTYAMQRKAASGGRDYDVTDTTLDQVFKGFDPAYENVIRAVEATRGVVGMADGGYAACYYTASNGGEVSTPGEVWGGDGGTAIRRHRDPFDLANPRSLVSRYDFSADLSDCAGLKKLLAGAAGGEPAGVTKVTPVCPEFPGSIRFRKLRFELTMAGGEAKTVDLDVYAQIKDGLSLGLNGGDWERVSVAETEDGFAIELRGFGHGAGMSQRGAQQMAECGRNFRQILAFYYPGMSLETLSLEEPAREPLESVPALSRLERLVPGDGEYAARVNVASALNVREKPDVESAALARLGDGARLIVCGEADGWANIRTARLEGWVKKEYIIPE